MAIKFEKKVILGSVTSFVVAAIGVVAVFFPDLFNLQKKKVNELNLILENKNDLQTFFNFLNDRKGEFVKLNIGYCVDIDNAKIELSKKNSENSYEINQNANDPVIEWYSPELFAGMERYEKYVTKLEQNGLDYPVAINPIPKFYKIKDFLPILPHIPESSRDLNPSYNLNMKNLTKYNLEVKYMQSFGGDLLSDETHQNIDFIIGGNVFKTEQKIDGAYDGFSVIYIEKGGFGAIRNDDNKIPFSEIMIKESSKNGKDYKWFVGENLESLANDEVITKLSTTCKEKVLPNKSDNDTYIKSKVVGYLSGYFSVSESTEPVNLDTDVENLSIVKDFFSTYLGTIENGTINSLEIEPINKKEFDLKNY